MLRISTPPQTLPLAAIPALVPTSPPEEAPLVRLEKRLSDIRRLMKKGNSQKPQALLWIRQIIPIFRALFGPKSGLVATLDLWLLEIAAGKLEKFPKLLDEVEGQLEQLLDIAEGDWLTKATARLPR